MALLQLRDEGKVDLHAPVTQYLPWFHVQSAYPPITVHHLLNHTAGIVCGTDFVPHGLYESWALRETKINAPPGTYFWYSNVGYKTLGFLLEKLTGQSYRDVIRCRVLEPLGMTQTYPAITLHTRQRTAIGYRGFPTTGRSILVMGWCPPSGPSTAPAMVVRCPRPQIWRSICGCC